MDSKYNQDVFNAHLLKDLMEGVPTFPFTDADNLHRTIRDFQKEGQCEYVIFKGVSHTKFDQLKDDRPSIIFRLHSLYIPDQQLLRIRTMAPTFPHEMAIQEFLGILILKYTAMGVYHDIAKGGSPVLNLGTAIKEPDCSWGPTGKGYITTALEVGMSESLHSLALNEPGPVSLCRTGHPHRLS
jgi:hypothetical protein